MIYQKNYLAYQELRKNLGEEDSDKVMILKCKKTFESNNLVIEQGTRLELEKRLSGYDVLLSSPYSKFAVVLGLEKVPEYFVYDKEATAEKEKIDEFQIIRKQLNEQYHSSDKTQDIFTTISAVIIILLFFIISPIVIFEFLKNDPVYKSLLVFTAVLVVVSVILVCKIEKRKNDLIYQEKLIAEYIEEETKNLMT